VKVAERQFRHNLHCTTLRVVSENPGYVDSILTPKTSLS
jgi:hypothetical protein